MRVYLSNCHERKLMRSCKNLTRTTSNLHHHFKSSTSDLCFLILNSSSKNALEQHLHLVETAAGVQLDHMEVPKVPLLMRVRSSSQNIMMMRVTHTMKWKKIKKKQTKTKLWKNQPLTTSSTNSNNNSKIINDT